MVLMIDNYDSFTYNIVQYLADLGCRVKVIRNDKIDAAGVRRLCPERLVISPGPGAPRDAGISCGLISEFSGRIPILGVCLGHQCIGQVFGGRIVHAKSIMHGKTSRIYHRGKGVFKGLPNPFEATRYHSLAVEETSLPRCLEVTARTKDGEIMGLQHRRYKVYGVQFHPESILTGCGKQLRKNFLAI